ncbi:hypothetical protein ES703_25695 [subsurface metagenome]
MMAMRSETDAMTLGEAMERIDNERDRDKFYEAVKKLGLPLDDIVVVQWGSK